MSCELKNVYACLPSMDRGVAKVIGGDPKGKNFLYTNGKCVVIRNIDNPGIADIYTEHATNVNVAKYSPSGFYIASGDAQGKLRIWDTTQKEHIIKAEYQPFSGKIKDIAWTGDSQRIAIVGEGREKYGAAIMVDTGASCGEVSGHSKVINSVDMRLQRPYRIVTGSDDKCGSFYEGPPFKFKHTRHEHSNFINCVRYSPDDNRYCSAGADGKICMYNGKDGEFISLVGGEKAHEGGIYAISWSPDSTQMISASGDKTVKLWDMNTGTAVTTFNMGSEVMDQQLGCLWQRDHLLSISLSGYINYLDKNNPHKPLRVIKGHSKSIQSLTVHKSDGRTYIYSGSHDGHINYWDADTGENDCFSGKGHSNLVSKMAITNEGDLVTCSMDDTVRCSNLNKKEYCASDMLKMDFQPKNLAVASGGLSLVVCIGQVVLLKDKKKVFSLDSLSFEPEVGVLHPSGCTAALGASDGKVYLYSVQGNTLKDEGQVLEVKGPVTDMAYSNDGAHLAVIDERKVATVFNVADGYAKMNEFYGHHAKPVTLAWSPDNEHFATAGIDMMVFIWTLSDTDKRIKITEAHRMHHVSSLAWVDENTLVTTSHDASVKTWEVKY